MAENMTAKSNTDKYQGTGRVASAIGSATLWSIPGTIVSTLASIPLKKSLEEVGSLAEAKGKGLAVVGGIVALGTLIYGAVSGWKKSNKGKAQFEDLKTQVDASSARADGLLTQVEGLNQEVGAHRKSFAELHAKHEAQSASHAAKHESRAEHGSHADAALHDKEKAATAVHAV